MYRCIKCGNIIEEPELTYDEYDRSVYRICGECGGGLMKKKSECKYCGAAIFEGERIFKIGADFFCMECVKGLIA